MSEHRRRLPHFQPEGIWLFVTWRLWGSLPAGHTAGRELHATPGHAFVAHDRILDVAVRGECWLKDPRIAEMVARAIQAGDTDRHYYELGAWVVMPNHVHILVLPKVQMPMLMRWMKGTTARRANQITSRTGLPFWQDESYDHWVRNSRERNRIVRYIEANPVSAGLCKRVEDWPWSSANWNSNNGQANRLPHQVPIT
jgi:REP element-mobilizing transposase RayT